MSGQDGDSVHGLTVDSHSDGGRRQEGDRMGDHTSRVRTASSSSSSSLTVDSSRTAIFICGFKGTVVVVVVVVVTGLMR